MAAPHSGPERTRRAPGLAASIRTVRFALGFGLGLFLGCASQGPTSAKKTAGASPATLPDTVFFSCKMERGEFVFAYKDGLYEVNGAPVGLDSVASWNAEDGKETSVRVRTKGAGEFVLRIRPGEATDTVEKAGLPLNCVSDGKVDRTRLEALGKGPS